MVSQALLPHCARCLCESGMVTAQRCLVLKSGFQSGLPPIHQPLPWPCGQALRDLPRAQPGFRPAWD